MIQTLLLEWRVQNGSQGQQVRKEAFNFSLSLFLSEDSRQIVAEKHTVLINNSGVISLGKRLKLKIEGG